jgi:hypothetical protein
MSASTRPPVFAPLSSLAENAGIELPTGGPSPEAVLASLLDLTGGIRLSDLVEKVPEEEDERLPLEEAEAAVALGTRDFLHSQVGDRVRYLKRLAHNRFRDPFVGPLPGPQELLRTLEEVGALQSRRAKTVRHAGFKLAGPFGDLFLRTVRTIRVELAFLRGDITGELRSLGSHAVALEALDGALGRGTVVHARSLFDEVTARIEESFAERLVSEVRLLPPVAEGAEEEVASAVATWFQDGGWIREFVRDLDCLTTEIVENECAVLLTLVDAACEQAVGGTVR